MSEGQLFRRNIRIYVHSLSFLKPELVGWFKLLLKEDKYLLYISYIANIMAAVNLAMQGARASTAITST